MQTRNLLAAAALVATVAACSNDTAAPTAFSDSDVALLTPDLSAGAVAGQASLPGLTMDAGAFFPSFGTAGLPSVLGRGLRDHCTYLPTAGRFLCDPVRRDGLLISRSFAFYDADGKPQSQRNDDTRSMNTQIAVTGTLQRAGENRVHVDRKSDMTVSGLGPSSTQHTLNGSERGKTEAMRTSDRGSWMVTTNFASSTKDVVIHVPRAEGTWPLSGTIVVEASVKATSASTSGSRSRSYREEVTFNGTNIVPVKITRGDVTKECTRNLETHKTTCP
jgi:hypothetical protein